MQISTSLIKKFSIFTIITAFAYLVGEGYFMYLYGQEALQTLADVIAIILLLFGGYIAYNNPSKLGILCGAWGFNFCINYRAWVWRYYAKMNNNSTPETDIVGSILLFLLIFSFSAFVFSIIINLPKTTIK